MYYAPHRLYRKIEKEERDELNRIISISEEWEDICDCRCDDNTTERFEDNNGRVYIPKYKIVCNRASVSPNDYVQCRTADTGDIRGEGRVLNAPKCNYLDYMVLYVGT
jgi:hypothetical protein